MGDPTVYGKGRPAIMGDVYTIGGLHGHPRRYIDRQAETLQGGGVYWCTLLRGHQIYPGGGRDSENSVI